METFNPSEHYIRLTTACPEVSVADVSTNVQNIRELYEEASGQGSALVVFPELSITGYTIGDAVRFGGLLEKAKQGLATLAQATTEHKTAMVVGLPLQVGNALYNCAAVLAEGEVKGIVPKQNLPTYGEFYEKRWYQKWDQPNTAIRLDNRDVPFGTDLLFNIGGVTTGVEICEDVWVSNTPSTRLVEHGALVIVNPSASPELVGKAAYRRDQLVKPTSARLQAAYAYAGSDSSESTIDIVMGGHQIIAENGQIRAERPPFSMDPNRLLTADVDIDHLLHERRRDTNFPNHVGMTVVACTVERPQIDPNPSVVADPFLPSKENPQEHAKRLQEAFKIAAMGLAQYMRKIGSERVVIGLSGGLDSTLALLIACQAAQFQGKKPSDMIRTLTLPGMGSTDRTQNNAQKLAAALDVSNEVISIEEIAKLELELLHHGGETQDITYENVQARARTNLLFNYGNRNHCLVLGTGDLSEGMLGWSTYNADQMSHYNVNVDIPKTQIRHMVRSVADLPAYKAAKPTLKDILATPFSPELTGQKDGEISQKTEDIIGPYVLHEFFGTYLIRWGDEPAKVQFLAEKAFDGRFEAKEIAHWLDVFIKRFIRNRFKSIPVPPGPKIGSLAIDYRSNLRLPSDLPNTALWS